MKTRDLIILGGLGALAYIALRPSPAGAAPTPPPGPPPGAPPEGGITYQSGRWSISAGWDQLMRGVVDIIDAAKNILPWSKPAKTTSREIYKSPGEKVIA